MTQCEKVLSDSRRCSNPAVPGGRYCQTHGRINFKPVDKAADTAPAPVEKELARPVQPSPAKRTQKKPKPVQPKPVAAQLEWKALPNPSGQVPRFPGLRQSERNLLVAPQGLIWLESSAQPDDSNSSFTRLVRLLGALSQTINLAGQVQLATHQSRGDIFVTLTPEKDIQLPAFYDAASSAARLVDARLYIGQFPHYVQYRDDSAPCGYDVPDFKTPAEKSMLLVARWGHRTFPPSDLRDLPISDFCLSIAPLATQPGSLPETIYAMTPMALYKLLAQYLRAHHLHYSMARFPSHEGELLLFEISPRAGAPAGSFVPAFVLAHLSRLPRLALLEMVHQEAKQHILLQWGHQYPLHIGHTAQLFPPEGYILLVGDPYQQNLLIDPTPQFFDGDVFVQAHTPRGKPLRVSPQSDEPVHPLNLPIVLRPDEGPTPPIGALLLSLQEVSWLCQLLYRLPGEVFGNYRLCLGEDSAVLLGGTKPIQGIPFGLSFRHWGDTPLFIPLRSRFVPDLPWTILSQSLQIQPEVITLLTYDARLDLPKSAFAPLSRSLVADQGRPNVKFDLRTDLGLPLLQWSAPPAPKMPVVKDSHKEHTRRPSILDTLIGRSQQSATRPTTPPQSIPAVPSLSPMESWRKEAQGFEEMNDYLAAAICYALVNDVAASARCLQHSLANEQK